MTGFEHAQDGSTPLLLAAKNGHVGITQLLKKKGANIEAMDKVSFLALSNQQIADFASERILPNLNSFLWNTLKA